MLGLMLMLNVADARVAMWLRGGGGAYFVAVDSLAFPGASVRLSTIAARVCGFVVILVGACVLAGLYTARAKARRAPACVCVLGLLPRALALVHALRRRAHLPTR
jgi:hypothetical protein